MKKTLYMICLVLVAAACPRPASGQTELEAWVQSYHKLGSYDDVPIALAVAGNGNVVVTGTAADEFDQDSWLTVAWSSSGDILWTQSYHGPVEFADEQPNAIAVDASGNTYVTGVILAADTFTQDYLTIKYSSGGVPIWFRTYNGTGNGNDGATAIVLDADGNVIVTGLSTGTSGVSSLFDCVTIKYSPDGVPLWVNRYNGPGNNEDSPVDVAVDAAGNVFVTGASQRQAGDFDYLTLAISRDGAALWARQYNGPGNNNDFGKALAVDQAGKVFVTGFSGSSSATAVPEYATVAYSAAGDLLWANRYHANNLQQGSYNLASDVAVDNAGNVFVTGGAGGGPGGGMATLKYSNTGTQLWTRIYKGPSVFGFNDDGRAVAIDGSGNVIVTGRSYDAGNSDAGDFATLSYSNAGVPLWTQRYNGPANGDDTPMNRRSLGLGPDGSVYVTGASDLDASAGQQYQFVVVKYTPSAFGNWAASYGLTGASASATADPENDGLANGVEFVLGGNPTSSDSASKHPAVAVSGGYLTFTFARDDASEVLGVTLTVESGIDLINWPDVFIIGPTTGASSPGATIFENGTAPDLITVSIPAGSEQSRFARLKVAIVP